MNATEKTCLIKDLPHFEKNIFGHIQNDVLDADVVSALNEFADHLSVRDEKCGPYVNIKHK